MQIACYVEPERLEKSRRFMQAFAQGCMNNAQIVMGPKIVQADVHVVWGHRWTSEKVVPYTREVGKQHIVIDNGWWFPAAGTSMGYFRMMVNGPSPRKLASVDPARLTHAGIKFRPWRDNGRHILICMPGPHFGLPWGISTKEWEERIVARVEDATRHPVRIRRKGDYTPFSYDLHNAHALITHSSAAAVIAATEGVPVFCEKTCAAYEVGNDISSLEDFIDCPKMPDRFDWAVNLIHQQWTMDEYREGKAWPYIKEMLG